MKIKVQIDPAYPEPEVHILAAEITDEIQALVQRLSEKRPSALVCYDRDSAVLVEQEQLIRVYASRRQGNISCAGGCMSWRKCWMPKPLCGFPMQRLSICILWSGWISALPAPLACG